MQWLIRTTHFSSTSFLVFCVLIIGVLSLSACKNHHTPAPVVSLSTKVASTQNLTEITTNTYVVENGDTLFAIAFYSGNDYRDLARINKLTPPYTINIGQTLVLNAAQNEEESIQRNKGQQVTQNTNNKTVAPKQSPKYDIGQTKTLPKNVEQTSASKTNNKLLWIWPADGSRTIATVGSDGSKRGLDIKGNSGAKVVAASAGKVVYAGNALKGYGNLVIIKHNDEYLSAYAHNKSILVGEQMYVKQGQQIATMGNSGASEVMLHFEIRKKGKSVDPFKYLPVQ